MFVKSSHGQYMVVVVYVDEILIASNCDVAVAALKAQLSAAFKFRDLGPPKFFLGIEIARSAADISLFQRKYVIDLLEFTGFSYCKPSSILMESNQKLSKDDGEILTYGKQYRKIVGQLQYLTITRPEIAFATSKLAQYSKAPRTTHLQAIHKVLQYLKGKIGQGLFYGADANFDLRGFSDSDWGACPDMRQSVTGFAMFLGDSLISWNLKSSRRFL